jgi:hypothetical protein
VSEATAEEIVPAPSTTGEDPERAYTAAPYDYAEARALMDSLGLLEPVAITLVRRGHRTVEQAKSFLAAEVSYDAAEFDDASRSARPGPKRRGR